jgi:hypothetical protein
LRKRCSTFVLRRDRLLARAQGQDLFVHQHFQRALQHFEVLVVGQMVVGNVPAARGDLHL